MGVSATSNSLSRSMMRDDPTTSTRSRGLHSERARSVDVPGEQGAFGQAGEVVNMVAYPFGPVGGVPK